MMAMILAAGLGTRLRPYTMLRPKPLFPVLGQPLLLRIIAQLRQAGFAPIVVNAYHLAEQIAHCLAGQADIILQRESEELGTGGGLRLALPHFVQGPVLVTNADIHHDLDYALVYRRHLQGGCPVTMVMHDYPRFNKVRVAAERVQGFVPTSSEEAGQGQRFLAFTGIHVLEPELLRPLGAGTFSSIIDCYQRHLDQGGAIQAMTVIGHDWQDMGTIADYLDLHRRLLLDGSGPCFRCAPGARLGRGVALEDWGYVGSGAQVGEGASLRRVVVWDGADVPAGSQHADCLIT